MSCRRRGLSTCLLHAVLRVGAAAFEASSRDVCVHFGWQEMPPARPQRMPLSCIVARWSRCVRGIDAFRLHPVFLAGAAADEASARDACGHCCGQEPPFSRNLCMPFASSDAGRCCRRRGLSACRGHPLLLAGAAVGEASVHAA